MPGQVLGFVGVGRMGGPMVSRLMEAGHAMVIYDSHKAATDPLAARGAKLARSPKDCRRPGRHRHAQPADARHRQGGGTRTRRRRPRRQGPRDDRPVDQWPGRRHHRAAGLAEKKIISVDSPVSGGIKGAVNGTLAVMVSCPKATYDEVAPILENFGKLFFTGEKPGLAQTAKLANNLMAAAALAITSKRWRWASRRGSTPHPDRHH